MTINVSSVVEFFWNGLTKTELIEPRANYVYMQVGIKFLDKYISNGWSFSTQPGDYITPDIIEQVVSGIAGKINEYASSASNPLIVKVYHPGVGDRGNILNQYEYFNVNSLVPYMSIVVTLRTVRPVVKYAITPVEANTDITGASAASGLDGTSLTDVPFISDNLATSADFETGLQMT